MTNTMFSFFVFALGYGLGYYLCNTKKRLWRELYRNESAQMCALLDEAERNERAARECAELERWYGGTR